MHLKVMIQVLKTKVQPLLLINLSCKNYYNLNLKPSNPKHQIFQQCLVLTTCHNHQHLQLLHTIAITILPLWALPNFFDRSESTLQNNQRCLMCLMEIQAQASLEVFVTIASFFEIPNLNSNKVWETSTTKIKGFDYLDFKSDGQDSSKFSIYTMIGFRNLCF